MLDRNTVVPTLLAVAAGMSLWFVAAQFIAAREPWDDPAYWMIAYPSALFVSGLLGFFYPDRSWRWAPILFAAQVVAMWIQSGEVGNLWPLTLVFTGIISLPAVLLARIASRFSRRPRS